MSSRQEQSNKPAPSEEMSVHIRKDLLDAPRRIAEYKERAIAADLVVFTLLCSDSRVVLPEDLVQIEMNNEEQKNILFIGIPTIGGGTPSRSRLRGVMAEASGWGVSPDRFRILVTQHGDSEEIQEAAHPQEKGEQEPHLSCGLRILLSKYSHELGSIRTHLLPWSDDYKRRMGNIQLAPDRLPLDVLRNECPDIMREVESISQGYLKKEGILFPTRLVLRAAYRNGYFGISENGEVVRTKIAEYLRDTEYQPIYHTCEIGLADYNHQTKTMAFLSPYATLGFKDYEILLPELTPRNDSIQDPHHIIISFGKENIPLHNGVILPSVAKSVHNELYPDNVFRACASIPSPETLLCAFAEAWYAASHKVHPHHGDLNFRSLEDCIIMCDDTNHLQVLQETLQTDEFQQEYAPVFQQLNNGVLYAVNLHLDEHGKIPELVELAA